MNEENKENGSEQIQGETFKDALGLPANQHAKKKAKEAAAKKAGKKDGLSKQFYSIRNGKMLMITATPKGAYSTYIGRTKKMTKDQIQKTVADWSKQGLYIDEYDSQNLVGKAREEMAVKAPKK